MIFTTVAFKHETILIYLILSIICITVNRIAMIMRLLQKVYNKQQMMLNIKIFFQLEDTILEKLIFHGK